MALSSAHPKNKVYVVVRLSQLGQNSKWTRLYVDHADLESKSQLQFEAGSYKVLPERQWRSQKKNCEARSVIVTLVLERSEPPTIPIKTGFQSLARSSALNELINQCSDFLYR